MMKLRPWQERARRLLKEKFASDKNTILFEAGIGSGKTLAALIGAKDAIDAKQISRIIVVTFTSHLVRQWGKAATYAGLNLLECRLGNGTLKDGFPVDAHGYITTFASVSSLSDIHETHASGLRTLVIIDEIHHLGEEDNENPFGSTMTKWAEECYKAFKNARMIASLSGTPYRTDKKRIPFVEYDANPVQDMYRLKSDVTYSYGESVFDGICRRVIFVKLDGPIDVTTVLLNKKLGTQKGPAQRETLRFADKIEPERWYDRLLAAVTIDHEYDPEKAKNQLIIDLLRAANNKLMDLRQSNPRAGGLLITGSKDAARKLKALLRQVTGHDAILVLEDIEKTSELIDAFRDGDSPWIISVNMVTEGVDIPRLRVCAYLSTKTAWLYVMQVIGRIVRDPPGQSYFFYFPDPRLEKIVAQIEKEMEVWLRKKRPGDAPPQSDFEKIIELNKATGEQWAGLVAGEPVTSAEMAAVEAMRHAMPDLDDTDYLTLLKMARMSNTAKQQRQQEPPPSSHAGMSYSEIRFELRGRIQKGVGRLNKLRGLLHNDIHHALNRAAGVRGKDDASREQLEHMLALIQEWIATAEHENGNHRQS